MRTRRRFLSDSLLLLAPLGVGCASTPVPVVGAGDPGHVALGLFPRTGPGSETSTIDAIHHTLGKLDLSWLKRGDTVFLKLASNSSNPHPATTSPQAVRAVTTLLKDRGAKVIVGDQGGVGQVRLIKGDKRHLSTRWLLEQNGLLKAAEEAGAAVSCFDDFGFDDGYIEGTLPAASTAWRNRPMLGKIVNEVDHIVYLPRLSSHVLCGYTHGHKIAVGWLRDDSRHEMHSEAGSIYEKYVEVNYTREIATRLRLVVTVAEEVLTGGGPDGGTIVTADPRIVLASSCAGVARGLADHDAVSVGLLTYAQQRFVEARNTGGLPHGPWASGSNLAFLQMVEPMTGLPWTSSRTALPETYAAHKYEQGPAHDRALTHAYALLGGAPRSIAVDVTGSADGALLAHLRGTLPVAA